MTRHKAFITAAARRRMDPIVWDIDGTSVTLRATVDLDEIADAVHEVQQPIAAGANQLKAAAEKRALLVSAVRSFVVAEDRDTFDRISADLDLSMLPDMLSEAIAEYTGAENPTSQPLSSGGSLPTGPTSADGAAPEA
jgi:hypothetical protein